MLLVLFVPAPRTLFSFSPIGAMDLAVSVTAAVLGTAWFELYKTSLRKKAGA